MSKAPRRPVPSAQPTAISPEVQNRITNSLANYAKHLRELLGLTRQAPRRYRTGNLVASLLNKLDDQSTAFRTAMAEAGGHWPTDDSVEGLYEVNLFLFRSYRRAFELFVLITNKKRGETEATQETHLAELIDLDVLFFDEIVGMVRDQKTGPWGPSNVADENWVAMYDVNATLGRITCEAAREFNRAGVRQSGGSNQAAVKKGEKGKSPRSGGRPKLCDSKAPADVAKHNVHELIRAEKEKNPCSGPKTLHKHFKKNPGCKDFREQVAAAGLDLSEGLIKNALYN